MSELVRWKEYRVRQEIYKEHLKRTENLTDPVDSGEQNPEERNRLSLALFGQVVSEG